MMRIIMMLRRKMTFIGQSEIFMKGALKADGTCKQQKRIFLRYVDHGLIVNNDDDD